MKSSTSTPTQEFDLLMRMRTKNMALLLPLIMLSIHLHASSQNLLVSALDQQEDQNVGDRRSQGLDVSTSMKVASGGVTVVDKRGGGGGGGHGGGGHGAGARSAGGSDGDTTGKGSDRGYAAVVPLFAAGAGAHHVNNRPAHHSKNGGTTTYIGLPFLTSGVLISLFVAQPI